MTKERELPHNDDAERTILGACLVDPQAFESAAALALADFYRQAHRRIFEAMGLLAQAERALDLVAVKDQLVRMDALEEAGGPKYLARLVDGIPNKINPEEWVRIVRDHARSRALIALGHRLAAQGYESEPGELADETVAKLLELADKGTGWEDNRAALKRALLEIEERSRVPDGVLGLRTGLIDLDRRMQGIAPGSFGVVGARLGQGKTTLALQVALAQKEQAHRVVVFSLEMGGSSLMKRLLGYEANVAVNRLHQQKAEAPEVFEKRWARIGKAFGVLAGTNIMLNTGCRTVAQMRAAAREVQVKHGLALVVVDYLQIVQPPRRRERRPLEIADISGELLQMAHGLNVPVVAVSQLNRESESRPDHRPTTGDLADGDSIGRDCDWCVLIQRDIKPPKGENADKYRNRAYLWVAKHRDGVAGKVEVAWDPAVGRFENLKVEEPEESTSWRGDQWQPPA
jgi:replicative DNA helicase